MARENEERAADLGTIESWPLSWTVRDAEGQRHVWLCDGLGGALGSAATDGYRNF